MRKFDHKSCLLIRDKDIRTWQVVQGERRLSAPRREALLQEAIALNPYVGEPTRVISDCHASEGASKIGTQIPIIHRFYLFSALPSHSLG